MVVKDGICLSPSSFAKEMATLDGGHDGEKVIFAVFFRRQNVTESFKEPCSVGGKVCRATKCHFKSNRGKLAIS
jgi:hypothetical protein